MRFKDDWNLDSFVDFNFYVENLHNQSIVSRKWLIGKIYEELATSEKGIILTAEMGYGKSSIVSNLVCAEQSSDWYALRKNVLIYHFCRYDSISSTKAAYFIRNIASAIIHRYPELGNLILSDDIANDILYGLRCSEDPISCLEIAILNPLRNKWKNYHFVIVIDALDECISEDKTDILQLLFKQMDYFPPNIKFVFTSRNIEQVLSKFKDLKLIQLSTFNTENEKDITQYIRQTSDLTESEINLLTNVSRGNFLHAKLYLQSCKDSYNCDYRNIPSSLEKIHQMNFERIFDTQSGLFEQLRPIFEVLCTMTKPMTEEHIYEVANISSENRINIERMIGNELGHFLISTNGYLSFSHKSIADFLTCGSRKHLRFFVRKANGHKLFAAYILKFNISEIDIADVVHHVAMSRNSVLQGILLQNYAQHVQKDTKLPILSHLHRTISDFNSYNTTNLLLILISMKYINDTNDRNMSAAFIAASYGNEHALKCLLDYGADPHFKVIISYRKDPQFLTDLVHKCKYIYFCGYNILHIASQNGHFQTVQMLVERFNDLIFTRNDMNHTPFDLAAENGHIEIAQYMLNRNSSFANFLSLYHAAQKGHLNIVQLLLQYGLKDSCLPCNGSTYWIPESHVRQQQDYEFIVAYANLTMEDNKSFYDDWYLITCDTALNTAVRHGFLKVVELLLNEKTNTLNCTGFDGKTPLLTAIQYNQTAIFKHLLKFKVNLTAKCRNKFHSNELTMYRLGKSELSSLSRERCADGLSIIQFLVVHWNRDIFSLLDSKGLVNLEERDKDQSTLVHYAFCHNNYEFVEIAINRNFNLSVRTKNGSTPYHSAALCKSLILFTIMWTKTKHENIIPDVKDIHGLSILSYGSLLIHNLYNRNDTINFYEYFLTLSQVAIASEHNIIHTDDSGRNFLHYAARNGNYIPFYISYNELPHGDINYLLLQKDKFGQTPVDELFASMPRRTTNEPFKLPNNCALNDIFLTTCQNVLDILSPHEYFISLIIDYLKEENLFPYYNITNYLIISIRKIRLYPLLTLKLLAKDIFDSAVTSTSELHALLEEFEGPNIAQIVLNRENAIKCNGKASPLHKTLQNDRGKYWKYSNNFTLSKFLMDYSARKLDFCVDNEGYNILQRAVMGGNTVAVKYLIEKGMNVKVLSRMGENLLYLAIVGTPILENGSVPYYYYNSTRSFLLQYIWENGKTTQDSFHHQQENDTVDFSETSSYILKVFLSELSYAYFTMLKNQLCHSQRKKLGLLHLAASKGFLQFLKTCKHFYGVSILNCLDVNDITPYYLAHIYNQDHVTEWMDTLKVHMVQPSAEVESLLLYNIVVNYKIRKRFHWSCRLHYSYRYMRMFISVFKRCTGIDENDVVLTNPYFMFFSHKLLSLSYINMQCIQENRCAKTTLNFKSCIDHFDRICSDKVSTMIKVMKMDKISLSYFERLQRKVMTFGVIDRITILQQLFKQRNVRQDFLKSLSFWVFFKNQYKFTELLAIRKDVHSLWLENSIDKLRKNGVNLKTSYNALKYVVSV